MNTLDPHAHALESMPALVSGRLSRADAARVLAHTEACADCRAELELGRRVHAHFAREWRAIGPLVEPARTVAGFDRLWSQITAAEERRGVRGASDPGRARRWAAAVTALAATVLVGVGVEWYRGAAEPQFRTFADPSGPPISACSRMHVQTAPGALEHEVRRALAGAGARIVSGPDENQVYTLAADDVTRALAAVRALPAVLSAEAKGC